MNVRLPLQVRILRATARALPGVPVEYEERLRETDESLRFTVLVTAGRGAGGRRIAVESSAALEFVDLARAPDFLEQEWDRVRQKLLAAIEAEDSVLASEAALIRPPTPEETP